MIDGLKKHIGQVKNTGSRIIVVFRKIPADDKSCLVIETDRLPDEYKDYVFQVLNSKDALETNEFYELLNRRNFQDGTNCLSTLHQRGYIRKELISNVLMLPLVGKTIPLELINASIDGKMDEYRTKIEEEKIKAPEVVKEEISREGQLAVAKGILARADGLEAQAADLLKEAAKIREEAYRIAPSFFPKRGSPKKEETSTLTLVEVDKRKEKDKQRVKPKKELVKNELAKQEDIIASKVKAKIKRDINRARKIELANAALVEGVVTETEDSQPETTQVKEAVV